ncbi:Unknown protein [Striga hermonthica]|uniref:Uncharacterized protein n=1 Tax=Striga hermonthica TaxID=68872 RepID=A0A9N7N4I7_STRHE|nr:Unknown protein [Striga hermonthica]
MNVRQQYQTSSRDESGNRKIPYRPMPYPEYTDRIPFWQQKKETGTGKKMGTGTGTNSGRGVSRPYSRIPYLGRKIPAHDEMEQQPPTAGGDGPGRASASVAASSASKRRLQLEPPQLVVVRSVTILPPNPTTGSKRSSLTNGSPGQIQGLGLCLSSATPSSSPATATDASSLPSGGVSGVAVVGSGSSGHNVDAAATGANYPGGQEGANTANATVVEGDEAPSGDEYEPDGKRQKSCTSGVWKYFTKKKLVIEDNGKVYIQKWAHCNYPKCKHKARCEGNYGTTGFWTHLRVAHSVQKGQQQLKVEKDGAQEIKAVVTYRYDEEASLRKFYLAIVMHEYPFNISEHEYFVDFIKSLRPSFPIKSRVTIRKEIMNMFLEEKEKLYAYFKSVPCRLSATMDMWTSNQNKSYMCVTVHWIDENWCIQKRIVNFVHVEGRHTGAKLSETFTELMVKWNIDKKLFVLTLDNASANEVAVKDIISDLRPNSSASTLAHMKKVALSKANDGTCELRKAEFFGSLLVA